LEYRSAVQRQRRAECFIDDEKDTTPFNGGYTNFITNDRQNCNDDQCSESYTATLEFRDSNGDPVQVLNPSGNVVTELTASGSDSTSDT
jgi:hypothetical protein